MSFESGHTLRQLLGYCSVLESQYPVWVIPLEKPMGQPGLDPPPHLDKPAFVGRSNFGSFVALPLKTFLLYNPLQHFRQTMVLSNKHIQYTKQHYSSNILQHVQQHMMLFSIVSMNPKVEIIFFEALRSGGD